MSDPISSLLYVGNSIIDKIWPDKNVAAKQKLELANLAHEKGLEELKAKVTSLTGQLDINKAEASHSSIFVAGWRPFCGWIGGISLAYAAFIEPLLLVILKAKGVEAELPHIDPVITMEILFGMLGLGAYRTYEKNQKINDRH